LPGQPVARGVNASTSGSAADINAQNENNGQRSVVNGGSGRDGEGWAETLQRELANRYVTSALCGW